MDLKCSEKLPLGLVTKTNPSAGNFTGLWNATGMIYSQIGNPVDISFITICLILRGTTEFVHSKHKRDPRQVTQWLTKNIVFFFTGRTSEGRHNDVSILGTLQRTSQLPPPWWIKVSYQSTVKSGKPLFLSFKKKPQSVHFQCTPLQDTTSVRRKHGHVSRWEDQFSHLSADWGFFISSPGGAGSVAILSTTLIAFYKTTHKNIAIIWPSVQH